MRIARLIFVMAAIFFSCTGVPDITEAAQGYTPEQARTFDWKKFGKWAAENADYSTKKNIEHSTEAKARFIAQQVALQMNRMGVAPNWNMLSRGASAYRQGDQSLGTCQHVSESLQEAMIGSGIDQRRTLRVYGEKSSVRQLNRFDVNRTHVALAVVNERGAPVMFDLWLHGSEKGTFPGFENSVWNGVPASTWSETMNKHGYLRQACEDCSDKALQAPYAMLQSLNDQARMVQKVSQLPSRDAIVVKVFDSRTRQPVDGAAVLFDGATNSPTEKDRYRGTTANGSVQFGKVKPGAYYLDVSKAEYYTHRVGPYSFSPPKTLEVSLVRVVEAGSRSVRITAPVEALVNTGVTFSAAISPQPKFSFRFAWYINGVKQQETQNSLTRTFPHRGGQVISVEAFEAITGQWTKVAEARHALMVNDGQGRQSQKLQPPAPAVNPADVQKQYDSCVQSEKNNLAEAEKQLSMVGQKDAWSFFRCGPIGTNWQMIPGNACCDPFKRDSEKNMTAAAAALQRCGWNEEIAKRRGALEKKTAECARKYPQATKR